MSVTMDTGSPPPVAFAPGSLPGSLCQARHPASPSSTSAIHLPSWYLPLESRNVQAATWRPPHCPCDLELLPSSGAGTPHCTPGTCPREMVAADGCKPGLTCCFFKSPAEGLGVSDTAGSTRVGCCQAPRLQEGHFHLSPYLPSSLNSSLF